MQLGRAVMHTLRTEILDTQRQFPTPVRQYRDLLQTRTRRHQRSHWRTTRQQYQQSQAKQKIRADFHKNSNGRMNTDAYITQFPMTEKVSPQHRGAQPAERAT